MTWELIGRKNQGEANETWSPTEWSTDRSLTETYIVRSHTYAENSNAVVGVTDVAAQLPGLGVPSLSDESSENPGMYCVARDFQLDPRSENIWLIHCRFTNNPYRDGANAGGPSGGNGSPSVPDRETLPWLRPAQFSTSSEKVITQTLYDKAGYVVATSAGEVLDGIQEELIVVVVQARQFEILPNLNEKYTFVGKTHETSNTLFTGYERYEVLLDEIIATPSSVAGYTGYDMTYRFKLLSRGNVGDVDGTVVFPGTTTTLSATRIGWRAIVPNYGTYRKISGAETVFDATATREKQRPRWWLTSTGAWAADNLSDISWLIVQTYDEADMLQLGIRF